MRQREKCATVEIVFGKNFRQVDSQKKKMEWGGVGWGGGKLNGVSRGREGKHLQSVKHSHGKTTGSSQQVAEPSSNCNINCNSSSVNCHCNSSNCSNILTALAGIATLFHFSSSEYFQQYFQQYFHQMSDSLNDPREVLEKSQPV